ncbi:unnamed protein product, partial [Discosporangium mesarthrocarpum]
INAGSDGAWYVMDDWCNGSEKGADPHSETDVPGSSSPSQNKQQNSQVGQCSIGLGRKVYNGPSSATTTSTTTATTSRSATAGGEAEGAGVGGGPGSGTGQEGPQEGKEMHSGGGGGGGSGGGGRGGGGGGNSSRDHSQDRERHCYGLGSHALVEDDSNISDLEAQLRSPLKAHIKHHFKDTDAKGNASCKFLCHSFWALQFRALRRCYLAELGGPSTRNKQGFEKSKEDVWQEVEDSYIQSLSMAMKWDAQGGKSGATFSKTSDERFVVKSISKTELQMFLDVAPHYFAYMAKAFFHKLPTVLCRIVGVYQIGYHNRVSGKKTDQVVVMQNIFYGRNISLIFDLKGSSRSRYVRPEGMDSSRGGTATAVAAAAAAASAGDMGEGQDASG